MKIDDKKILILGLGREGSETLRFLRNRFSDKVIGVADQFPLERMGPAIKETVQGDANLRKHFGEDYLKGLCEYDLVFKSPGIKNSLPEIAAAEQKGVVISSNTELFFDSCKGMIIGVTGTKGKSTTASLIYEVLKTGGLNVCFGGNIGMAPLSLIGEDDKNKTFVLELSSFQLAGLKRSPQVAVIQAIVREHLDYHGGFSEYLLAKENIVRHQEESDRVIFNRDSSLASEMAGKSKGEKLPFGGSEADGSRCFLDQESIIFISKKGREEIISAREIPLLGSFNIQNVMPAIVIGRELGISAEVIKKAIKGFHSLPHRLELVKEVNEVSFYNDSLATIPEATIAALEAFPNKKIVLISGGFDRGQDFSDLGRKIADLFSSDKISGVILFPATGEGLWKSIQKAAVKGAGLPPRFFVRTMEDAVAKAFNLSEQGGVVLLSPAAASFGIFKNYAERGEKFKSEVGKIIL